MAGTIHETLTGNLLHVPGYFADSDPGAVGAGKIWVDTSGGAGSWIFNVRNAADDGWESINLNGPFVVGDIASNGVLIDPVNGIYLYGSAVAWDDLRFPALDTKLGGSKDPTFAVFKTNGAGSQGVFLYWFDKNTEGELYFVAQLPHKWAQGTDLEVHCHWVPKATAAGAGTDVCWGLEYTWVNINGTFGNTALIYGDEQTNGATETLTAGKHYLTELGTISGSGKTLSSMLVCRIFRDAGGTGGTDDYDDDAGLLEVDFHIQIDSFGSDDEYTKGP